MICLNCTRRSAFDTRMKLCPLQCSHECPAAPVFCRRVELRTPLYVSAVTTCCQNKRNDIGTRISILISIVGTDSPEKLFCVGCTFARRKLFDRTHPRARPITVLALLPQPTVALDQSVDLGLGLLLLLLRRAPRRVGLHDRVGRRLGNDNRLSDDHRWHLQLLVRGLLQCDELGPGLACAGHAARVA